MLNFISNLIKAPIYLFLYVLFFISVFFNFLFVYIIETLKINLDEKTIDLINVYFANFRKFVLDIMQENFSYYYFLIPIENKSYKFLFYKIIKFYHKNQLSPISSQQFP